MRSKQFLFSIFFILFYSSSCSQKIVDSQTELNTNSKYSYSENLCSGNKKPHIISYNEIESKLKDRQNLLDSISPIFKDILDSKNLTDINRGRIEKEFNDLKNIQLQWNESFTNLFNTIESNPCDFDLKEIYEISLNELETDIDNVKKLKHKLDEILESGGIGGTSVSGFIRYTKRYNSGYEKINYEYIEGFRYPPIRASSSYELNKSLFPSNLTYSKLDTILIESLNQCGYYNFGYYSLPDSGFVLVTPIERIDTDGFPITNDRFKIESATKVVSFMDYFKSLFIGKSGYCRVFAFMIYKDDLPIEDIGIEKDEAYGYLTKGKLSLPQSFWSKSIKDKRITVNIYVFKVSESNTKPTLVDENINTSNHMKPIIERLQKNK